MRSLIVWYALVGGLGIITLPITYLFVRRLPDRGYCLTRPLSMVLLGYGAWIGSVSGLFSFNTVALAVEVGALAALSIALLAFVPAENHVHRGQRWTLLAEMYHFYRQRVVYLVAAEAVFGLTYCGLAFIRTYDPAIQANEKFMDYAFLNTLVNSAQIPPGDPWYNGAPLNYYYFGHIILAALTRLSGVTTAYSYNIALCLLFALSALGLFGLAYNLTAVTVAHRQGGAPTVARSGIVVGLLAPVFALLLGNFDGWRQLMTSLDRMTHTKTFEVKWLSAAHLWTECIPSDTVAACAPTRMITEFPAYSFLIANLHSTIIVIPFDIVAIGFALSVALTPPTDAAKIVGLRGGGLARLIVAALVLGALTWINSWDFPTCLVLTLAAYALAQRGVHPQPRSWRRAAETYVPAFAFGGVAVVLYLPFLLSFASPIGGHRLPAAIADIPGVRTLVGFIGIVPVRTRLIDYLTMFGLFAPAIVLFLGVMFGAYLRQHRLMADIQRQSRPIRQRLATGTGLIGSGAILVLPCLAV